VTLSFAASYACLCVAQGATVAAPRIGPLARLAALRSRWWALVPVASIVVVIFAIRATSGVAGGLTYLALATTPPLAAVALAWLAPSRRVAAAALVVPLFALAWAARGSLAGEASAVALTALGCATLGSLLASVTPPTWLKLGIVGMAVTDTVLVVVDLLQQPNGRLNAAAPGLGLPQFQRALFGDALMGYGDLFIAAVLGALLARSHARQRPAAISTTVFALAFGLLFFWVNELPATVPVALAMLAGEPFARRVLGPRARRIRDALGRPSGGRRTLPVASERGGRS
jgi:uncharacterized integral membrane protein